MNLSIELELSQTPTDAWAKAAAGLGPEELCVAAGSVFLVAELRRIFTATIENA
jgi:hypothetical protein